MNKVLLDKNAGSNKLCDSCNKQGIVECFLLPRAIRDTASDPEVADFAIKHDDFIVTFDRGFCCEAGAVRAGRNPGVLLLREDDNSVKRISRKTATAMLSHFKQEFQDWPKVACRNSLIELTPKAVVVYHTLKNEPLFLDRLDRQQADWQSKLKQLLETNASAKLPEEIAPPPTTGPDDKERPPC
jgi:predicted nuclease of predicted toxin-antitoxin system